MGRVILVCRFGLLGYPSVLECPRAWNYPSWWVYPGGKGWFVLKSGAILVCCVILVDRVRLP